MKKLVFALFMVVCIPSVRGQEWVTDLDIALEKAVLHNKNVLLFFSVPDFCERCELLEKNIFNSQEFIEYAQGNFILARIEFINSPGYTLSPEAKAKNLLIVEKYNKDGFFPLVVLLNKQERVLGKIGVYSQESPEQYVKMLQSLDNN